LKADNTYFLIKDMADSGILEVILPQIKKMYGCQQGGYHHLDVWEHTMLVLYKFEELISRRKLSPDVAAYLAQDIVLNRPRYALIKLACLLHDVGKPKARRFFMNTRNMVRKLLRISASGCVFPRRRHTF
jgi:poly(A) polymerase